MREAGRTSYGRPAPCTRGNHCLTCTIGVTAQTCTSKRLLSIHRQIHREREVQNLGATPASTRLARHLPVTLLHRCFPLHGRQNMSKLNQSILTCASKKHCLCIYKSPGPQPAQLHWILVPESCAPTSRLGTNSRQLHVRLASHTTHSPPAALKVNVEEGDVHTANLCLFPPGRSKTTVMNDHLDEALQATDVLKKASEPYA